MLDRRLIRNDAIRADAESLIQKYSRYSGEIFKKRFLSFHDASGAKYNRLEIPHYALTSELQYWLVRDGAAGDIPAMWWDMCDSLVGYWINNLSTGNVWPAARESVLNYLQNAGVKDKIAEATLNTLARHIQDIPFGAYLINPFKVLSGQKATAQPSIGKSNGSLAGVAIAGLAATALFLGRRKK